MNYERKQTGRLGYQNVQIIRASTVELVLSATRWRVLNWQYVAGVCHMIITSKPHGVDVIGMIESGFTCRPQKSLNILSLKGGIYKQDLEAKATLFIVSATSTKSLRHILLCSVCRPQIQKTLHSTSTQSYRIHVTAGIELQPDW